jgi:hypothetical protein
MKEMIKKLMCDDETGQLPEETDVILYGVIIPLGMILFFWFACLIDGTE